MDCERNSDGELFELFLKGDRDAFAALYRTHHSAIFRFACHMTEDRVKAGDLTQDVFVWLIHHPRTFDPERGDLEAFLVGVARKLLQRKWRDERRWLPFDEATRTKPTAQENANPESGLQRAIDSGALRNAIALLPERYREVIVLCDLDGKSYEEAARFLDCAVGTIRSRLHRARELLVRKLRPQKTSRRWRL
jgi:RNA polymerase sigma-70 factor (ECF subfamily)